MAPPPPPDGEHGGLDEQPRKGRSNAILTYEKLAEFSNSLTTAVTLIQGLREEVSKLAQRDNDLEVRLRVQEIALAGLVSSTSTSRENLRWGWTVVTSLATCTMGILGTYIAMSR